MPRTWVSTGVRGAKPGVLLVGVVPTVVTPGELDASSASLYGLGFKVDAEGEPEGERLGE